MYSYCKIKNIDSIDHSILGVIVAPDEEYVIPDNKRIAIAGNSSVITLVNSDKLQVGNEAGYLTGYADQLRCLFNTLPTSINNTGFPFSAKRTLDGKKLYGRTHGKSFALSAGANTLDFDIPYAHVKITGVEVVGGEVGDTLDFFVLDDDLGTYSTVPNYQLNQFGYDVAVSKDFYKRESPYDADLYYNMCISISYYSQSAKTVYINYVLHEVKD